MSFVENIQSYIMILWIYYQTLFLASLFTIQTRTKADGNLLHKTTFKSLNSIETSKVNYDIKYELCWENFQLHSDVLFNLIYLIFNAFLAGLNIRVH